MSVLTMKLKRDQLYIPKRYQQVVALHILKNNLKKIEVKVPLLLGIYGPTGEGKTVQCETVLKNMGVKSFLISGGQLDSDIAGQSAQLVRSTYIEASTSVRRGECSLAAVLINDIDTGLGSVGGTSKHTMNQLTVFADLMHLVDYPTSVEGKDTLRIPIVITGNDFTKLYEPLVRAGRMTAFEWIPTLEERARIISYIFPELSEDECNGLITDLSQEILAKKGGRREVLSIAFFSHLRANLLDEDLWNEVEKFGLEKTVDIILTGNEPDFSLGIDYARVLGKGKELARSGQLVNHLDNSNGK